MLDITAIEDAIYAWVSGASGIETIIAFPNAPRPKTQYALINIVTNTPVGVADRGYTLQGDDSIDVEYSNVEDVLVSINVYYDGAYAMATKIKDSLARVKITDALFEAGLGYSRATTVNHIPEEIDKEFEQRAQFDCYFFTRSLDAEENIATIQKIQITNELDGETVTIEKP